MEGDDVPAINNTKIMGGCCSMKKWLLTISLFILFILVSCTNNAEPAFDASLLKHSYTESDEDMLNPERGFFTPISLPTEKNLQMKNL